MSVTKREREPEIFVVVIADREYQERRRRLRKLYEENRQHEQAKILSGFYRDEVLHELRQRELRQRARWS